MIENTVIEFNCGPRVLVSGFESPNDDLNGLWTLAMKNDGTVEINDEYPYYKKVVSLYVIDIFNEFLNYNLSDMHLSCRVLACSCGGCGMDKLVTGW